MPAISNLALDNLPLLVWFFIPKACRGSFGVDFMPYCLVLYFAALYQLL